MSILDRLLEIDSDLETSFGNLSSKSLYSSLLDGVKLQPRVCRLYPTVDFSLIFKEIYRDFIENYVSDISWKILHEILPINYVLYVRNISRDKTCTFCDGIETFDHLFFDCPNTRLLVHFVSDIIFNLSRGSIGLTYSSIRHTFFDSKIFPSKYVKEVIYYLISELKFCIWMCRNCVKFDHKDYNANTILLFFISRVKNRISLDFIRLDRDVFEMYWCHNNIICKLVDDTFEYISL